ncbi:MAG: DUF2079 domain-containing protein [Ruminococcus sp.]|nr:DUF2079 domain-containing protein [Ruminococcus sp.]
MKQILSEQNRERIAFIKAFLLKCGIPEMFMCRFVGMYFLISGIVLQMRKSAGISAVNAWKDYVKELPIRNSILWMIFGILVLTIIYAVVPKKYQVADQIILLVGTMFFAFSVLWRLENYYLAIGLCGIVIVFVSHLMGKISAEQFEHLPDKASAVIVAVVALAVLWFVGITSVMHHKVFGTSCFDFGIFVQMFYSLRTELNAITTCERDMFLSHFNVHASFIYYLLVPVYALSGNNECSLLISQAVLAMGGVIPLYLIVKHHDYKGFARVAICMVYIFYSGLLVPCYYDYHENSFLPTLLMWLLYAIDQKKFILMYIMAALTCIVKEDAPLYVICLGMYFLFEEQSRKKIHGLIMMIVSGIYFIAINHWLGEYGDGEMMASSRFGNLTLEEGDSLFSIVGNVLKDPAYFFSMFVKEQTLLFVIQVMMPLLFLPFMTSKLRRFLLIIPFVIMNLVVGIGYGYAASIGYQYIFGPSCLLIYMALLNAADMEHQKRNTFITVSACVCMVTAVCLISGRIGYLINYNDRKEYFQNLEACLDTVPEDGRVNANAWFLPHLADRREIYIFDRNDFETNPELAIEGEDNFIDTITGLKDVQRYDFYVMSRGDENTAAAIPYLEELGFTPYAETENYVIIYVSPEYLAKHQNQ